MSDSRADAGAGLRHDRPPTVASTRTPSGQDNVLAGCYRGHRERGHHRDDNAAASSHKVPQMSEPSHSSSDLDDLAPAGARKRREHADTFYWRWGWRPPTRRPCWAQALAITLPTAVEPAFLQFSARGR